MSASQPLDWTSDDGVYRIRIARRCFQRMQRLAAQHLPEEVGTPLVGYYSDDHRTAFITSIGPLPPDSKRGRFSFVRGVIGLPEFFRRLGRRFGGRRYRVGEWHSHPLSSPRPSGTDDQNQLALARDEKEMLPEAVLVILGGHPKDTPALSVFVYSRTRDRVDLRPLIR